MESAPKQRIHEEIADPFVPWSKVAILGMVIPPLIGILINPYYWVDDQPLLYGNNRSLDPGTFDNGTIRYIYITYDVISNDVDPRYVDNKR